MAEPKRSEEGGGIADALRRYVDVVAGATEAPREAAGKVVGDLAKRGESRAKDIQRAARDIADRSARDRRDLMRLIQKEIRRQVETLGLVRRTEVERLQKRVRELERKVPAKPSPKKRSKPAARKSSAQKKKSES